MFSTSIVSLDQRTAFIELLAGRGTTVSAELGAQPGSRQIVRVRANRIIRRTSVAARTSDAVAVNLAALAVAFVERLRDDGAIAATPQQTEQYASAMALQTPRSRRSLYYLTREIFITEAGQMATFNRLFAEVFGKPAGFDRYREQTPALTAVG